MSAYAYYQAQKYDDCINSAKRYVTLHPGSPDAAYAQYLIGASYYDQIPDVTRDQAPRREGDQPRSKKWCANIRISEYAVSAKKKIDWRATSSPARRWRSAAST